MLKHVAPYRSTSSLGRSFSSSLKPKRSYSASPPQITRSRELQDVMVSYSTPEPPRRSSQRFIGTAENNQYSFESYFMDDVDLEQNSHQGHDFLIRHGSVESHESLSGSESFHKQDEDCISGHESFSNENSSNRKKLLSGQNGWNSMLMEFSKVQFFSDSFDAEQSSLHSYNSSPVSHRRKYSSPDILNSNNIISSISNKNDLGLFSRVTPNNNMRNSKLLMSGSLDENSFKKQNESCQHKNKAFGIETPDGIHTNSNGVERMSFDRISCPPGRAFSSSHLKSIDSYSLFINSRSRLSSRSSSTSSLHDQQTVS